MSLPSLHIQGVGWVTPFGAGLDDVWTRIQAGEKPPLQQITAPHTARANTAYTVPPKTADALSRNPRIRRSSVITHYALTAAMSALENAGIAITPETADRTAVVFAICSGGVVYTRKFYETIVLQGANAASPLLFPETVYNAPASHLSALLGVTGISYTVVGDGTVGISALKFAEQLFDTGEIDHCIVVGAEEVDWILCEAYRDWRLPVTLAEGAAAIVLGRTGKYLLDPIHPGISIARQSDAPSAIRAVHRDLASKCPAPGLIIAGANGTFIDKAETAALAECYPSIPVACPKHSLGDALGAGALMQTIHGALAIEKLYLNNVIVSALGFNQQATGLVLSPANG